MVGNRVSGLPTDAPMSENEAASVAEVTRLITNINANYSAVPEVPLRLTNKMPKAISLGHM